jgi:thiamine pyrophosphate-dependent acetolactate synthase large subunit-like protein
MTELASGHLAVRVLRNAGIEHLFTLSGGHLFPLYDGCRHERVQVVDTRHEQAAMFAAEGLAKLTRRPQAAALTAGPGVTNAVSAVAGARFTGVPVLALGGRAPKATWGAGSLQELDHVAFMAPLTKHAATAMDPAGVADHVSTALRIAASPHRGPVFVDVPMDVIFTPAGEGSVPAWREPEVVEPDEDLIAEAAATLAAAERPVVVAGTDVWFERAEAALRDLAETAHVPVVMNGMGRGCLPADHALAFARARGAAFKNADVVLVVGTPLDFRLGFGRFGDAAVVIGDGGDFVSYAGRLIDSYTPGCWLDPGPYGCLGTGMGYAIAARLARPDKQVAVLLGDGAAGFGLLDAETLVRHGLPVVMIVGNNGIWGLEKFPMQQIYDGWHCAADLQPGLRYDDVVAALGGAGETVEKSADLGPALERAFAADAPYLVNVLTDPAVAYPRSTLLA